jgi:hypothetical protein
MLSHQSKKAIYPAHIIKHANLYETHKLSEPSINVYVYLFIGCCLNKIYDKCKVDLSKDLKRLKNKNRTTSGGIYFSPARINFIRYIKLKYLNIASLNGNLIATNILFQYYHKAGLKSLFHSETYAIHALELGNPKCLLETAKLHIKNGSIDIAIKYYIILTEFSILCKNESHLELARTYFNLVTEGDNTQCDNFQYHINYCLNQPIIPKDTFYLLGKYNMHINNLQVGIDTLKNGARYGEESCLQLLVDTYIKHNMDTTMFGELVKIADSGNLKKPKALVDYFKKLNELQLYLLMGDTGKPLSHVIQKYKNKVNHMQIDGECSICYNTTKLIPFDCCHYVCSQNCYPILIYDGKCPMCKLSI